MRVFVERRPAQTLTFFRDARPVESGLLHTATLLAGDSEQVLELILEAVPGLRQAPTIEPFGLELGIVTEDVDRHADILMRTNTFAAPFDFHHALAETSFLALYPSGAVRSAFIDFQEGGSAVTGQLQDPFVLLDPDADPPRSNVSRAAVHKVVVAGFRI